MWKTLFLFMAIKDTVENTIFEARTVAHITQEELAVAVGVTRQTIIAIEKGKYTPSVALALRMSRYFKKPVEKLFFISH
jgi:putative transcriptional regulator